MDIEQILQNDNVEEIISQLKRKSVKVPEWSVLKKQYDPKYHPVNDVGLYKDRGGKLEDKVIRITYDLQRLAVKRTSELVFGIPVKRIYNSTTEPQKEIAKYLENIFQRIHVDSVNFERGRMLFAGC